MKGLGAGRRFPRLGLATVVSLILSTSTFSALADSTEPATARQHYLAGAEAYSHGKYSDAIEQFLAADRIAASAALSYDIARAYEKLGDSSFALRWYRDYLHHAGDPADGAKVRRIVSSLERELRSKGVQQITVRSIPRGATVVLDGEPAGVTPWTSDLPPGVHRLVVVYDGYERAERAFTLPPEEALDIDVRLKHAEATAAPGPAAPQAPNTPPTPADTTTNAMLSASPEPAKPSSTLRTIGIVGMSVGGAALGGALAFEILRHDSVAEAKKDRTQVGYSSKLDAANERQTASRVLLGVGAGLAITGGVLFFVGRPSGARRTEISLGCTYGACGASASGRF